MPDKRFAVLASGGGSNLQALIDRAADGYIPAEPSLVLTDRRGIGALERAEAARIPTAVLEYDSFGSREEFTAAVVEALRDHGADFVCLAGFMRILAPLVPETFPDKILNTHPSLLPSFPGAKAVAEALAYGVKVTGCTIHFIDEQVDHGPIVFQEAIAVHPNDDAASLHDKIKKIEHRIFPEAARLLALGRLAVRGRRVLVTGQ
jgi:phosphoribosylglycinamide formyltransferase-1